MELPQASVSRDPRSYLISCRRSASRPPDRISTAADLRDCIGNRRNEFVSTRRQNGAARRTPRTYSVKPPGNRRERRQKYGADNHGENVPSIPKACQSDARRIHPLRSIVQIDAMPKNGDRFAALQFRVKPLCLGRKPGIVRCVATDGIDGRAQSIATSSSSALLPGRLW